MKKKKAKQTDLFGNLVDDPATDLAASITPEMEEYREHLQDYTVEQLQRVQHSLGFEFKRGNKAALVSAILGFLSVLEQEQRFKEWLASLPSYLSLAIETAMRNGYVDAGAVEAAAGKPVAAGRGSYYYNYRTTNRDLRLGIFDFYTSYGRSLLILQPLFRRLLARWLPTPSGYVVRPCPEQGVEGWSAADTLAESMPLLFKSLSQVLEDHHTREKALRRGLNKTTIKELRRDSAFPSFPIGSRTGIDPIELIAGLVMIDPDALSVSQSMDVRDFTKRFVSDFFTIPDSGMIKSYYLLIDSSFEFSALCPHLTRTRRSRRYSSPFHPHPPARSIFKNLLSTLAETGRWYDVNAIARSIHLQALAFTIFANAYGASEVVLKGDLLNLPEGPIEVDEWDEGFTPDAYLTRYLITSPLLKSYCYLMASLGILEIEEQEPAKLLQRKGKLVPISPSEPLARVRVTPFGAWCLGTSTGKPELREVHYEAIADRKLPLVTYRGRSVECKVYLKRIGDPIGEDRFRITEASFVRDCTSKEDIEHRIGEFHRLIAQKPAAHWDALFSRVLDRADLFQDEEPCMMIKLPEDKELRRIFLEDKKLASLVVRAEGGRVVVTQRNYRKLRKALAAYGVLKG